MNKDGSARGLTRRSVMRLGAAGGAGAVLAACRSAAPISTSGATPAASTANSEWDRVVAAAKKEGKAAVAGGPGDAYRRLIPAFQKTFPEITLEWTGIAGADFGPKILAERQGGQFLWDAHVGGAGTMFRVLKPAGALAPLREALLLPEILDSSKWLNGFDAGWMDADGKLSYAFQAWPGTTAFVNRDQAPEQQLRTFDQLLDPQWKGKIAGDDPRRAGVGIGMIVHLLLEKGEAYTTKYLQQELVVTTDARQLSEWMVRGAYPIGVGLPNTFDDEFLKQGLGKNLKALEGNTATGIFLRTGFGCVSMIERAPHPNAAKVFVNWLLSKEGQTVWSNDVKFNSRRLDVSNPPDGFSYDPKTTYKLEDGEKFAAERAKATELSTKYLR